MFGKLMSAQNLLNILRINRVIEAIWDARKAPKW